MTRRFVLIAAAARALTGCAGSAPQVIAPPGQLTAAPTKKACGTITLAKNPWVGYEANLAVVKTLAERELGCKVVVKDGAEADSWQDLAAGKVDAILENWGHDDLMKKYIDTQGVAVEGGLTGNKGVIGWYVPSWMAAKYPDITTVKGLKARWRLFVTDRSGGKGQFLAGDPSYVTNDANLMRNLALSYSVVYSGSEDALIAAFRAAEQTKKPLLGYFYSPQWLHAEIKLAQVTLPAYTPGCDADPKTVTCDYQPYDLDKIMNKKFATSGNPAATLIRNFSWTNDDQNQVARDIHDGMTPDDAAQRWLNAHPTVWRAWLRS